MLHFAFIAVIQTRWVSPFDITPETLLCRNRPIKRKSRRAVAVASVPQYNARQNYQNGGTESYYSCNGVTIVTYLKKQGLLVSVAAGPIISQTKVGCGIMWAVVIRCRANKYNRPIIAVSAKRSGPVRRAVQRCWAGCSSQLQRFRNAALPGALSVQPELPNADKMQGVRWS